MRKTDRERTSQGTWVANRHPELVDRPIAYFCAEFGLHNSVPIYSGGLGVLAGDHCKAASDLGVPLVGGARSGFLAWEAFFFFVPRRPPRSRRARSSAASGVYKWRVFPSSC